MSCGARRRNGTFQNQGLGKDMNLRKFSKLMMNMGVALGLLGGAASANENVIMVLDGSGSMWGQIDGKTKIEIARDVIGDMVQDWDANTNLGLVAYGHRNEGDCTDIETLIPAAPVNAEAFMTTVNGINPKGKTPITEAVRKAAEALRYKDEKATVILVSDGLETCNADPCALATDLENGGVDFTTHVIGFDISQEESAGLSCLAENTGGRFLRASNATELTDAVKTTVQEVSVAQAEIETEPEPEVTGPQGVKLIPVYCEGCDEIKDNLFWWIYEPTQDVNGNRKELKRDGNVSPLIELNSGNYFVQGRYGTAFASAEVTVEPGKLTTVEVNFNAGNLRVKAAATEGADPLTDNMFYWVYEAKMDMEGNRKEVDRSGAATDIFRLPAGEYFVQARHGTAFANATVTVKAGELTDLVFDMNAGYMRVNGVPTAGADPLDNNMFYWVYENKKDLEGNRKEIDRSGAVTELFRLNAGEYFVVARHGKAFAEQVVTVEANTLSEITFDLNVGYLKADAIMSEGSEPITENMFYWVYENKTDLEGNRKEIDRSGAASHIFRLPAGEYFLVSRHGKSFVNEVITIDAGSLTETTMNQNSAKLKVTPVMADGGAVASDTFWWVYEKEQDLQGNRKEVDRSGAKTNIFILPAGDYVLAVRNAGAVQNTEVSLTPGQVLDLSVSIQ